MREIKFRAWDKKNKKMIKYLAKFNFRFDGILSYISKWDTFNQRRIPISEVKIMQYTGLKDKNGKKIWEGDIIQQKYLGIAECTFRNGSFEFRTKDNFYIPSNDLDLIEVIGNIYENPELLTNSNKR